MSIKEVVENSDIILNYIMFPLHPDTPDEGITLEELFAGRDINVEASNQRFQKITEELGLDYSYRTVTYNSRLAQELAKWAETQPDSERIHDALYKAYFVDSLNLAVVDNLLSVVKSLEMDVNSAKEALENRLFKNAVDTDWSQAYKNGIRAVPSFVSKNRLLQGYHDSAGLAQLINQTS